MIGFIGDLISSEATVISVKRGHGNCVSAMVTIRRPTSQVSPNKTTSWFWLTALFRLSPKICNPVFSYPCVGFGSLLILVTG